MSNKLVSWIIFIVLCFIWGSSFKLMQDSQVGLNSVQIAAVRIFSAGLVFVPFAFFHFGKIPKEKILLVILSAVFGNLLPAFLFAEAIMKIDASLAGILNSLTPICVVVISLLFFRDRIGWQKILGVLIGFSGLVLLTIIPIVQEGKALNLENLGYTLLIVLATFLYGINVNMVSHHLKNVNPIHIATVSLAFMIIPTAIVLWQQDILSLNYRDRSVQYAIWASVGLGVAGSAIATALFYILVQKAGGLFASLVTYGIPFVALFWGFLDGEKITWIQIGCLFLILVGVYLANRKN